MRCKNCGREEVDGAKFCSDCGTLLEQEKACEKEVPVCPSCGKELEENMKFCPYCGEKLPEKKKLCPNCGAEANGNFCEKCGAKLNETFIKDGEIAARDSKSKNRLMLASVVRAYKKITSKYVIPSLFIFAMFFACLFGFLTKSIFVDMSKNESVNFSVFYFFGECYKSASSFNKQIGSFVAVTILVAVMLVGTSAALIVGVSKFVFAALKGKKYSLAPAFIISFACYAVGFFTLKFVSACISGVDYGDHVTIISGIKLNACGYVGLILPGALGLAAYVLRLTVDERGEEDIKVFIIKFATKLAVIGMTLASVIVASGYDVIFNQAADNYSSAKSLFTSFAALLAFSDGSKTYADMFSHTADSLVTKSALVFSFKIVLIVCLVAVMAFSFASVKRKSFAKYSFISSIAALLICIAVVVLTSLWANECVSYYNWKYYTSYSVTFPRTITALVLVTLSAMLSVVSFMVDRNALKKEI